MVNILKEPRRSSRSKKKEVVIFDQDGWADISKYKPEKFELVHLLTKAEKRFVGWWNGWAWEGKFTIPSDLVAWKRYKFSVHI